MEGSSVRAYKDQALVVDALKKEGFTEVYKPAAILPLGEMEKLVGKKVWNDTVVPLLVKPSGKPTLVVETDKRPALSTLNDFQDETV